MFGSPSFLFHVRCSSSHPHSKLPFGANSLTSIAHALRYKDLSLRPKLSPLHIRLGCELATLLKGVQDYTLTIHGCTRESKFAPLFTLKVQVCTEFREATFLGQETAAPKKKYFPLHPCLRRRSLSMVSISSNSSYIHVID